MNRIHPFVFATFPIFLFACEPDYSPGQGSHAPSSQLAIHQDGSLLYALAPDSDEVYALDSASGQVVSRTVVAGHPHRLTMMQDGRIAVVSRYTGELTVLSGDLQTVEGRMEVGADPFGVIEADGHLVVAIAGQQELARIPVDNPTYVKDRIALDYAHPRGLVQTDDGSLFVSHFMDGKLSRVDLTRGETSSIVHMNLVENPHFFPNQLDSLSTTPDRSQVAVPHQEVNNDPTQFANGGSMSGSSQTVEYYADGPTGYPAVVPANSRIDAKSGLVLSKGPGEFDPSMGDVPGLVTPVFNPYQRAHLGDEKVVEATATAFAHDGRLEITLFRGSGRILFRRSIAVENLPAVVASGNTDTGASSLVVSPDGTRVFALNTFTNTIYAFEIPHVEYLDVSGNAVSIASHERQSSPSRGIVSGIVVPQLSPTSIYQIREPSVSAEIQEGRRLFYGISESTSSSGVISCASCHPDGMADGTTWNFAQGPRQTPALWGGIRDTAPFHWDQKIEDTHDLNRNTIRRMGGNGLTDTELNNLWTFIDSIPVPAASFAREETSVDRGRDIFFSTESSCTSCHAGADFTDHQTHDVGTADELIYDDEAFFLVAEFATPVLHGLSHTAPYMHDGSAATLRDLIDQYVATDLMGYGSHLSEQEKDDLAAFLETL